MRGRFRRWIAGSRDRLLASDPGLARFQMALSAVIAMATTLGVEYVYAAVAKLVATDSLVVMLLGAVIAMMGSMALTGGAWVKVRTAVFFPVAVGAGLALGITVSGNTDLMLGVFVVVMFVAVFVRRFGVAFFYYGFMMWMGYFFASFLHATFAMLPILIIAVALASAWVLVLALTLLRSHPRRTLARILRAYGARARGVLRTGVELLQPDGNDPRRQQRWRRRLLARQVGLSEVALIADGRLEESDALPVGWSAGALRRRLLDLQQTIDRVAASVVELAGKDAALVAAARRVVGQLALREDDAARVAATRLGEMAGQAERGGASGAGAARYVAASALEYLELAAVAEPPQVDADDDFASTEMLFGGHLPGSGAMAKEVPARGSGWNPLARLNITTRQAIQVVVAGALAILLGRELSETRYYWAVIAAFVAFTGTATRSETLIKAVSRVVGTVLGLIAAIGLANLTAGHTSWVLVVILASMFCGFYLVRLSYVYMIFFITIMVGQLYSVLNEFSDALLLLRLEETAIGAGVGIVVALVFAPLSTRDTVRAARNNLLDALSEFLRSAADGLESPGERADLDALSRILDNRARQLALVAKPLIHPVLWGSSSARIRHRLDLYLAISAHARAFTVGLRRQKREHNESLSAECRVLADTAGRLADARFGRPEIGTADAAASALLPAGAVVSGVPVDDPLLRPLLHLHDVLAELASGAELAHESRS